MNAIEIPYTELEDPVLNNVIEEFVSRDGTDFSDVEAKKTQVIKLLKAKKAKIIFDFESESCQIVFHQA